MASKKHYKFNKETLECEEMKESTSKKVLKFFSYFVSSIVFFLLAFYLYSGVLNYKTPKQQIAERNLIKWQGKLQFLNRRYNNIESILSEIEKRDNNMYRPIFGLDEISSDVRNAGFGGIERYSYLKDFDNSGILTATVRKMDILYKKVYVQSKSLDELTALSKRADEMSVCIPSIPPMTTDRRIRYSSRFGMRLDPVSKDRYKMHSGIDLAGPIGEPVYSTGNGKVTNVGYDFFGYGNYLEIDHGFGYKTKYAHLHSVNVSIGDIVRRGDMIATLGNTGHTTGPHLHYEIRYKGRAVNPINYFSFDITPQSYALLVKNPSNQGV
ncbi:MAG: M23 family metallopeptidase [Bacteroidales bacterium]